MMYLSREGPLSKIYLQFEGKFINQQLSFYTYSRDAIHEILKTNKINSDDEIILPNFICSTVIEVIINITEKIKFYDINNELNYCENEIAQLISSKTKLIFFVDYFGVQSPVSDELQKKLKIKNIIIVKDAAHSFLTEVDNDFIKNYDYDYLISSIYKNIPLQVGSIAIGNFDNQKNFINLFILIKRFLVLFTKNLIYFLGLQKFLHTQLYDIKISTSDYKSSSYGTNAYRMYYAFFKKIDFKKIISERQDLTNKFDDFIRNKTNFLPIFNSTLVKNNVLQAYPVILQSKIERDILLKKLIDNKIDAYTWPTFHSINCNEALWTRLLLLPIDNRVLKVISNV